MQRETNAISTTGAYPDARPQVQQHVYPPPQQTKRINLPSRNIQPKRSFPSYKHLQLTPNLYAGLNAQLPQNLSIVSPPLACRKVFIPPLVAPKSNAEEQQSIKSFSRKSDDDDIPTCPTPVRTARNREDSDVPFLLALAHLPQRALELGEAPDSPETSVHEGGLCTTLNQEGLDTEQSAEDGEDAEGEDGVVISPLATIIAASTFCGDEAKGGWNITAWQNAQESRSFGVIPYGKGLGAGDAENTEKDSVESDTWAEDSSDTDWEHLSQFRED